MEHFQKIALKYEDVDDEFDWDGEFRCGDTKGMIYFWINLLHLLTHR
jgi:hypothetical protein